MTRTLIEIPDSIIDTLTQISEKMNISRSELIRTAIKFWLKNHDSQQLPKEAFGILKGKLAEDGVEFQHRVRSEW